MNKKMIAVAVLALVMALVVAFIFGNSLKSRDESKMDSDFVAEIIGPIIESILGREVENVGFIVRKIAHFTEFGLLGIAASGLVAVIAYDRKWWLCGYGLLFCLLIAVCDEFIQSFVDRGSAVSDVLIDFGGALTGFFALIALIEIVKLVKNKKHIIKKETDQ